MKKKLTLFRQWLRAQKRSALRFGGKDIARRSQTGWTTEDFLMEANHRGVPVRMSTAYTWGQGTVPNDGTIQLLKKKFSGIQF